jgi:hypothetical protein
MSLIIFSIPATLLAALIERPRRARIYRKR